MEFVNAVLGCLNIVLLFVMFWVFINRANDPANHAVQKLVAAERDIVAVVKRLDEMRDRVERLGDQIISMERRVASLGCTHNHTYPEININGGVGGDVVGRDQHHDGHHSRG